MNNHWVVVPINDLRNKAQFRDKRERPVARGKGLTEIFHNDNAWCGYVLEYTIQTLFPRMKYLSEFTRYDEVDFYSYDTRMYYDCKCRTTKLNTFIPRPKDIFWLNEEQYKDIKSGKRKVHYIIEGYYHPSMNHIYVMGFYDPRLAPKKGKLNKGLKKPAYEIPFKALTSMSSFFENRYLNITKL